MSTTLKDIAKATGFSLITISRAINQPDKLKPETRVKVLAAIAEHGYYPNSAARALVSNKTDIIYVYIPGDLTVSNPFFVQVVAGIGEGLGKLGYSMLIKRTWYNGEPSDGIILMGLSTDDNSRLAMLSKEKPIVVFGNNEVADCIDVNNRLGVSMAADYAFSRGYRKLAYIGIAQDRKFVRDRENGFLDSLEAHGIDGGICPRLTVLNNEADGYRGSLNLLANTETRPDCVIAASDDIASGVLRAAKELGLKIPTELGIIGFDGLGSERIVYPNLTTIHQPIYEIGEELAKLVVKKIKERKKEEVSVKTIFYTPVLYENETTK